MNRSKLLILAFAGAMLGTAPVAKAEPMPNAKTWHHHRVSHWHHRHAYLHRRGVSHSYTAFSRRINGVPCGIDCRRSRGQ